MADDEIRAGVEEARAFLVGSLSKSAEELRADGPEAYAHAFQVMVSAHEAGFADRAALMEFEPLAGRLSALASEAKAMARRVAPGSGAVH